VDEFPLGRVAAITGVDAELIRAAARMYATTTPGVIPWTPITDQQRNSTSGIRLHCALRALTGNLDVPGGEVLHGFDPDIVSESELELHDRLSEEQRAKQLGSDRYPAFTYRGTAALREPTRRVWGLDWANVLSGSFMANPSATFRAMADGDPYPVRAFITTGNNTLMSYANMQLIYRALMAQELVVAHEHVLSPTAQLADYVLPGDSWLERPALLDGMGWVRTYRTSQQAVPAPGSCRSAYDLWRGLAVRMGLAEHFPWVTLEDLLDHRVARTGKTFAELAEIGAYGTPPATRKYETTGFATPSGRVELASSVLADLGFDPLPYYRAGPQPDDEFPLELIMGVREDEYFQTGVRHVAALRRRRPEPEAYLHPDDARELGVEEGEWVQLDVRHGRVLLRAALRDAMPRGVVRAPHGWWKPELPQGRDSLSGAWAFADALLCSDDDDFLDREQGIPHLKGVPCRVTRVAAQASGDPTSIPALVQG
jgi:anaerobic selenocysteine-containing dehydrogenase